MAVSGYRIPGQRIRRHHSLERQGPHPDRHLPVDEQQVSDLSFSPEGNVLAGTLGVGRVRLWNVAERRHEADLPGHNGSALDVAFSPNGTMLASVGDDRSGRLWDPSTTEPVGALAAPAVQRELSFSPDGNRLATAGDDDIVRLWDLPSRELHAGLRGHAGSVNDVAFSPDRHTLASGGSDTAMYLWELDAERVAEHLCAVLTRSTLPANWPVPAAEGRRRRAHHNAGYGPWTYRRRALLSSLEKSRLGGVLGEVDAC